jgi:hypothetical protein
MCGRPLVETAPLASRPEPPRRDPDPPSPAPAYTGGLFNLNAPAEKHSANLDYLLEDEDEPKSSKGLILLTLVALALVVGLGWLRWRNGGLPFLKSLTAISQPKTPANPQVSGDTTSAPTTDQQPAASGSTPSITPIQPAADSAAQPLAPTPATSAPASATSPPTSDGAPPATASSEPPASAATPPASTDSETPSAAASEKPPDNAAATTPAPSHEAAPGPKPRLPSKPVAASKPAATSKAADPVVIGERYLYGREGFPQNCERGLHYVKPAADQSNPKAMITMGALYATGHCLSRDLPTAYRFFALALRNDPENGPLRQNAEMVWKQMTAEERKQAIRMTQ